MRTVVSNTFRLIAILAVFSVEYLSAGIPPTFTNLSVVHGLTQNSVWCMLRDRQGFLWFGTDDGLNKYDGYSFHVYRHIKNDSTSLTNNSVRALMEDNAGMIWIGTSEGVNVYDPVTDKFSLFVPKRDRALGRRIVNVSVLAEDLAGNIWVVSHTNGVYRINHDLDGMQAFTHDERNTSSLSSNAATSLFVDKAGTVWIGTEGMGINKYDPVSGGFVRFRNDPLNRKSLSDDFISSFYEDTKGRFWVGTLRDGIALMDRAAGTFRRYNRGQMLPIARMDSLTVTSIVEDRSGRIVYGTFGAGVKFLDPATGTTSAWTNDIRDPKSLAANQIISLYPDAMDNLWVGTYLGGISKFDPNGEHFQVFRNENPRTGLFTDNNVRSISRDAHGVLFLGTAKGLNVFDPATGLCEHFQNKYGDKSHLTDNVISAVFEDSKGVLWIGSRNGLMTFDRGAKRFTPVTSSDTIARKVINSIIRSVIEDRFGIMWIGTVSGLCSYDRTTNRYHVYPVNPSDPHALGNYNVRSLFEDHTGTIWVGTYGAGVYRLDRASGTFTRYRNDPASPNSLSDDLASPIREDNSGNIWIGTYRRGVNKLDPRTGKFTSYTESEGLTNNTIFGLEVDNKGNVWIATMHGVSCLDPATEKFRNYSIESGLQGEEFNLNASFKDRNGAILFGGNYGLNLFQPDAIRDNTYLPPVYITAMTVFNKPVRFDTSMTLKKHIELSYDENSISFEFVALNFRKTELNQYKYMLEGLDKEWSPAGTTRKASYTNLHPGEYVFRVMGANNDHVWNPVGASVRIIVHPPFWQTWWAYGLYVLGFVWTAFGSLQYAQKRQRRKLLHEQQRHEAEVVRQKNIKLKDANDEILRQQDILKERNEQIEHANSELTRQIEERERLLVELKTALADVKTLGGLIPICSSCKKIRDDEGYWNILESYLVKHSDAQFSHGICPDCATRLYPEFVGKHKEKQPDTE